MPKHLMKELAKCKHPKSRKTLALARKIKKINNREKKKIGHAVRANVVGKKLGWFAEHLEDGRTEPLSSSEFEQLIDEYLIRFDEELEQIKLVQSISKQRNNQHASREASIKMTLEKETNDFNGGGLELPNLCHKVEFRKFQNWDGDAQTIQHLKLHFISRKSLETAKKDLDKDMIME
ncbi:translation machinery-associated protein 16 homolog [Toxorhynchites rutilus septentrionalis]|uniref:translation machinery-associated protein 16 homolog n=1 Tax=Toxorhynchites rutilus septentrionalis TaxID=329112 RepID=UPI002478CEB4|nr:translation machinery-associated protein 16 homolog [Toxorhynchites rutilus septentrionalis]